MSAGSIVVDNCFVSQVLVAAVVLYELVVVVVGYLLEVVLLSDYAAAYSFPTGTALSVVMLYVLPSGLVLLLHMVAIVVVMVLAVVEITVEALQQRPDFPTVM